MATKTITLELDAYEKLRKAKRSPRESFSSVVRRAVIPEETHTAADLLLWVSRRMKAGSLPLDEAALARLDEAQEAPRESTKDG
jgi:predicted CopG family antitoxin